MLLSKNRIIRRRAVVGLLLAASLTLLTLSFRQGSSGIVGEIQRDAVSVTAPFSTIAHRVTRPAVDAWNWGSGLASARDSTEQLKHLQAQYGALRVRSQAAAEEVARLKALLHFRSTLGQTKSVAGQVLAQSPNAYQNTITIDIGTSAGVAINDPVVAPTEDSGTDREGRPGDLGTGCGDAPARPAELRQRRRPGRAERRRADQGGVGAGRDPQPGADPERRPRRRERHRHHRRVQGPAAGVVLPAGHPHRTGDLRLGERHDRRHQGDPGDAVRRLPEHHRRPGARAEAMILDGVKIALCVFVLAILEVAATPQLTPFGGGPDLIIILVVALALWRGTEAAAIAGFAGGLLLDAMTFEHLGMESLVYVGCAWAIATYAGRREAGPGMLEPPPPRPLPWLVIGATAAQLGSLVMHILIGDHPAAGILFWHQIAPAILQTTLLGLLLLPLLRRIFRPSQALSRVPRIATA